MLFQRTKHNQKICLQLIICQFTSNIMIFGMTLLQNKTIWDTTTNSMRLSVNRFILCMIVVVFFVMNGISGIKSYHDKTNNQLMKQLGYTFRDLVIVRMTEFFIIAGCVILATECLTFITICLIDAKSIRQTYNVFVSPFFAFRMISIGILFCCYPFYIRLFIKRGI